LNRLSSFILPVLALCLTLCAAADAQTRPADAPPARIVERQAILVTFGPGDAIWERFGHNLIWVRDARNGFDACYNWGLFDFDEPGFIRKFIAGDMTYSMDAFQPLPSLNEYRRQNRTVRLQRLDLTDAQLEDLIARCETNRLPENRYYAYNYFTQNCSTMVRDMIDVVAGGALSSDLKNRPADSGLTYRQQTMRAASDDLWLSLGMDLLMGPGGDRPLTAWEECFLPSRLADYATPVVRVELPPLWNADRPPEPKTPPKRTGEMAVAGCFLAFILLIAGLGNRRWTRATAVLLAALWMAFSGVAAVLMLYLWGFTRHVAAHANWNLLQFSLLSGIALLC
jgi:hypothetical protein